MPLSWTYKQYAVLLGEYIVIPDGFVSGLIVVLLAVIFPVKSTFGELTSMYEGHTLIHDRL